MLGAALTVDRCVCKKITFAELARLARERGCGVGEVAAERGAGRGCGLCRPYVESIERTGRTSFAVNDPEVQITISEQKL